MDIRALIIIQRRSSSNLRAYIYMCAHINNDNNNSSVTIRTRQKLRGR